MANTELKAFQKKVKDLLVRNSNIVDIITKYQSCCAKICRSSIKAATGCGCISVTAKKTPYGYEPYSTLNTGINGTLCNDCKSIIEEEIGESLFYIASLCNAFDISLEKIANEEIKRVRSLGRYSLR